jgi:hypothetical protein
MKADINNDGNVITITLSKRNLLALLSKVDDPDSQKTISKYSDKLGQHVRVKAEPDNEHYGHRKAGPMSEKSEKFIREYDK